MGNLKKVENYELQSSQDTLSLAVDLANFIKEKKLYQNIQGKEFVNVEGWQYAGIRLGIVPIVEEVENISTDDEIKYRAKVRLMQISSGLQVGSGFAICSNREQGKKYYQEFAIASMSQTRAIGKAYRNCLSWVIKAAGYEPTPAEEMDYDSAAPQPKGTAEQATPEPQTPAPEPKQELITVSQKKELTELLNNPVITQDEKGKMLVSLSSFTNFKAAQSIEKIKKTIEERSTGEVKE